MAKKYPDPTPPKETSAAQTGTSVSTAIANSFFQNPTEIGPDGSTRMDPTGSYSWTDPYTGQRYDIPTFTRTTTLSPEQQAIANKQNAAKLNLAGLAADQSGFLQNYLSKPVSLDNDATEARLLELGRKRLDPMLADRREAEATRLANQGIRLGSTAYDKAMGLVDQGENDALVQLLLQGRGQAVQEALTERNQPINEISALMSGSQVSQPQFMGSTVGAIPTTDNSAIIASYDDQRRRIAEAEQASLGGLFKGVLNFGSTLIGLSDERLKKDKKKIGEVNGMGLYSYRMKGEPESSPKQVGLMAQEVEKVVPSAVTRGKDGYRRVDYGKALGLMGS